MREMESTFATPSLYHTKITTQFKGLVKGLGARSLQLIFDDLATLHHKFNSLQLGNIL